MVIPSFTRFSKLTLLRCLALSAIFLTGTIWCTPVLAAMRGACSDCHTMHNSQDNSPMTFDNSTTPNSYLTRGTCLGCHAQGGPTPTVVLGSSTIPQVMLSGLNHLAGGNFGYITGLAGSGAANNKGHNIDRLTGTDNVLYAPPGGIKQFYHDDGGTVNTETLTCAGTNGCHGSRYRYGVPSDTEGISGSHHNNEGGQLITADEPANSYRFLMGVKGFESADWQENASASNHNEYFALSAPVQLGCGGGGTVQCHGAGGVQPPDGTMSQFCATCHGNFHTLATSSSDGVGTVATSPFIRHPTDLSLPATGEYAAYTTYKLDAPVARLAVPTASSSSVTPGSDAVMCLSCHLSHASNYPSMLRWDYAEMIAGNGGSAAGTGCFACHSTKD